MLTIYPGAPVHRRPLTSSFFSSPARASVLALPLLLIGCTDESEEDKSADDTSNTGGADGEDGADGGDDDDDAPLPGIAVLGHQGQASVNIEEMASSEDGLRIPRDLAFDPEVEGLLWVVNQRDDSVVHIYEAGTSAQTTDKVIDPYALHFMDEVSSIDFGAPGTFGTCQESRNTYNGAGRANEFMGPTLWPADLDVFGTSNPEAVEYLSDLFGMDVDLGSHLDMLHESPLCMGITWDVDNVYWVVDGYHGALVRYDFVEDHGVGYDDHSDGIIFMHTDIELGYVEGVPAHLELDQDSRLLYIADPANQRVLTVEADTGYFDSRIRSQEPGVTYQAWSGTYWSTFLDGTEQGFSLASGVEFLGDLVLISDNATGEIIAFDKDGNEVDRLDTGLGEGSLMGMAVRNETEIWFTDAVENKVYRLTPGE
jgi:hypothetical protein